MQDLLSFLTGSPLGTAVLCVLGIALVGFFAGRARALSSGGGDRRKLHSLPNYYGWNVALIGMVPAFIVLFAWTIAQPILLERSVSSMISEERVAETGSLDLVISEVRRLADGVDTAVAAGAMSADEALSLDGDLDGIRDRLADVGVALGSDVTADTLEAAQAFRQGTATGHSWKLALVIAISLAGTAIAYVRTTAAFRARNTVEQGILAILIAAASIAILTTIGIVLSLVFNTFEFFDRFGTGLLVADLTEAQIEERILEQPELFADFVDPGDGTLLVALHDDMDALVERAKSDADMSANFFGYGQRIGAGAAEFFTGTTWQPSFSGRGGASELGILPLLWGTLYISFVALLVAVPIGLFAAIYLSEYAGPKVRSFTKPLLEILAGIPTIVYGLFALLIVGPFLKDIFGGDGYLGVAWMAGDRSVITAGVVMGMMLIPFVSSLSDDIINAVPQAMRDGSLGLGATPSETIRQVVVPAALPGIVGAILLAASRAIGETMIVVLGAGAAGRLDLNPFEAMTTVTAKIVSQLTGDSDFSSPEALVAFALGMTLFVFTLGLNVLALYIVRKYREQYE